MKGYSCDGGRGQYGGESIDRNGRKVWKEAVQQGMDDLLEQAAMRAGRVISRIPEGSYSFSDYLDDDMISDVPIRLAVTANVSGGRSHWTFQTVILR